MKWKYVSYTVFRDKLSTNFPFISLNMQCSDGKAVEMILLFFKINASEKCYPLKHCLGLKEDGVRVCNAEDVKEGGMHEVELLGAKILLIRWVNCTRLI